ncbi:MAG: hypothetical protein WGN25_19215 [Candidatus Electrothrix sp. GW3-4]|uniref:DUF7660 family protein n=1 Tax=Candidatus Electrothrix sp. GW3-4 TaxID=3126740 RepID=UPI0030D00020
MINYDTSNIKTREDFVRFLRFLYHTYLHERSTWENETLENFLEALTWYTEDLPGSLQRNGEDINADTPSWQLFADMLIGATLYE